MKSNKASLRFDYSLYVFLYYLCNGADNIKRHRKEKLIFISYLMISVTLWVFRSKLFGAKDIVFGTALFKIQSFTIAALLILGVPILLFILGIPKMALKISKALRRIGFCNSAGEYPILIRTNIDKDDKDYAFLEFDNMGIPVSEFEDHKDELATSMNRHICFIMPGKDNTRVLMRTITGAKQIPDFYFWEEDLPQDEATLVLGKTISENLYMNLNNIPHVLIGGSTGSGKTEILQWLLYQNIKHGHKVIVADFKTIDFNGPWKKKTVRTFNLEEFKKLLVKTILELDRRKQLFNEVDVVKLSEYNEKFPEVKLKRIIVACDEVAEILDKTGKSKEAKAQIDEVIALLSTIARLGRAFGIHLFLATQRPDATILPGQIKNNIDMRICGRADDVLSQIILDSTAAKDAIPKYCPGRFITNEDIIFQAPKFNFQ